MAHCGNIGMQLKEAKKDLERWDIKGEDHILSEAKILVRRKCMANVR